MLTTHAIILRSRDIGEAHRIYTMYTRDHGKLDALATGVRKIGSKLAGHLTEESILRCTFVPARDRMRLVHAQREQTFPSLYENLHSLQTVHIARECIDQLIRPGIVDAHIFDFLVRLFSSLHARAADPDLLLRAFLYHVLDALGVQTLPYTIQKSTSVMEIIGDHLSEPLTSLRSFALSTESS